MTKIKRFSWSGYIEEEHAEEEIPTPTISEESIERPRIDENLI